MKIKILNESELFLHKVKWFQVLLSNLISLISLHTVCSIWPIDKILSDATTLGQSGPWSNGNEGVLCISKIPETGCSPSDWFTWYPGYTLGAGGSYPFAEMQSEYSTALANWARMIWIYIYVDADSSETTKTTTTTYLKINVINTLL